MGKYLFFDIDGTLAGKSRSIVSSTREALTEARARGHRIIVCTGRSPASIVGDVTELTFDGMISGAGSFVKIGETYIYEHYLERETLEAVIALFDRNGILYSLEGRDAIYQTQEVFEFFAARTQRMIEENPELARFHSLIRKGEKRLFLDQFDIETIPIAKICFVAREKEWFAPCVPALEKDFNIVYFSKDTEPYLNGEIIWKGCTKGDGVRRVMEYFHGDMEDTVAFGDSMNDYQMLEAVHTGVAFEGAPRELKDLAQYYFYEPDKGGIADVMRRMGLA